MFEASIPGYGILRLKHIVLDYNGTLACDGEMFSGVQSRLTDLAGIFDIHVLTADTFGKAASALKGIPCSLSILAQENQDEGKLSYIKKIGAEFCVCIGNGRNDRLMLKEAGLGICVILDEGAYLGTIHDADVVFTGIIPALDLLANPLRLRATLRS